MTSIRLLLCVACVAMPFVAAQDNPAPSGQLRVAVVDLDMVFQKYERRAAEEQKLNLEVQKISGELAKLKLEIDDLLEQRKSLNEGSAKRGEVEQQIYEKQTDAALLQRLTKIEMRERMVEMTRSIYNDIRRHIKDYAVRNGYDLVLRYDAGELKPRADGDIELTKIEINARQVLYFSDALDISAAILEILNKK